jgi:hypothetical protein
MPIEKVQLLELTPSASAALLYLDIYGGFFDVGTPLAYLQRVRSEAAATEQNFSLEHAAREYERALPQTLAQFERLIAALSADLLVCPPSFRKDATPYMKVARSTYPTAHDASEFFHRLASHTKAGTAKKLADVLDGLAIDEAPNFAQRKHVLIVDDVYADGRTAAAVVYRLRERGLSADAQITVACPLRVRKQAMPRVNPAEMIDQD